jgi:hypothetical protein
MASICTVPRRSDDTMNTEATMQPSLFQDFVADADAEHVGLQERHCGSV